MSIINPCELPIGVTALAAAIARGLSDDELTLAAAVFTQLGDTLSTISAQRALCKSKEDAASDSGYTSGSSPSSSSTSSLE